MKFFLVMIFGGILGIASLYYTANPNAAAQRINQLKQDSASFHGLYMKANTINKQFRDSVKTNCTCI